MKLQCVEIEVRITIQQLMEIIINIYIRNSGPSKIMAQCHSSRINGELVSHHSMISILKVLISISQVPKLNFSIIVLVKSKVKYLDK
jgi:hypothetical protein